MPINEGYTFERFEKTNLAVIRKLIHDSFGREVSLKELAKKYDTASQGGEVIGFIAYDSDSVPSSFYGLFPTRLKKGNGYLLVAQSGDTMTAPGHQKRGLFVEAAKRTYEIAKAEGIKLVFGFPNQKSFSGFERSLNWKFQGHMYDFKVQTNCLPIAALLKRVSYLTSFSAWLDRRLSLLAVELNEEIARRFDLDGSVCPVRDEAYLSYKLERGARIVRWHDFEFIAKIDGVLLIGDVVPFDICRSKDFVNSIKQFGRSVFCHEIIITVSLNHWLFDSLAKVGIVPRKSLPIGLLQLTEVPDDLEEVSFSRLDFDTF